MSTYLYFRCLDHDPPLIAEEESGQHLYDLPQMRKDLADRERIVASYADGMSFPSDYFRRNTAKFFVSHATCTLGIIDEYDKVYPNEE